MRFLGRQFSVGAALPGEGVVLGPGTAVDTPDGPGVVERVELALVQVGTRLELDVPQIWVRLKRSKEIKKICLCKLSVADPAVTETLHAEFHRLWPPLPPEEDQLPPPLISTLMAATGRVSSDITQAAAALSAYRNPVALLRSAATAAVLNVPAQRVQIERAEASVRQRIEEKSHA